MTTQLKTLSEWKQKTIQNLQELDKKESFYITVPREKIGQLGGFNTAGYIAKYTASWGKQEVTYHAAIELLSVFQSWQWHVCFATDINKRLRKDEAKCKIHSFKTLEEAIKFVVK